jgi:hypothetical protein
MLDVPPLSGCPDLALAGFALASPTYSHSFGCFPCMAGFAPRTKRRAPFTPAPAPVPAGGFPWRVRVLASRPPTPCRDDFLLLETQAQAAQPQPHEASVGVGPAGSVLWPRQPALTLRPCVDRLAVNGVVRIHVEVLVLSYLIRKRPRWMADFELTRPLVL